MAQAGLELSIARDRVKLYVIPLLMPPKPGFPPPCPALLGPAALLNFSTVTAKWAVLAQAGAGQVLLKMSPLKMLSIHPPPSYHFLTKWGWGESSNQTNFTWRGCPKGWVIQCVILQVALHAPTPTPVDSQIPRNQTKQKFKKYSRLLITSPGNGLKRKTNCLMFSFHNIC